MISIKRLDAVEIFPIDVVFANVELARPPMAWSLWSRSMPLSLLKVVDDKGGVSGDVAEAEGVRSTIARTEVSRSWRRIMVGEMS